MVAGKALEYVVPSLAVPARVTVTVAPVGVDLGIEPYTAAIAGARWKIWLLLKLPEKHRALPQLVKGGSLAASREKEGNRSSSHGKLGADWAALHSSRSDTMARIEGVLTCRSATRPTRGRPPHFLQFVSFVAFAIFCVAHII